VAQALTTNKHGLRQQKIPSLGGFLQKPRMSSNETTATANSTNATDSTIVDLEAEVKKERAHHERHLEEMRQTLTDEITKMKLKLDLEAELKKNRLVMKNALRKCAKPSPTRLQK
jgi:hypothetical protein